MVENAESRCVGSSKALKPLFLVPFCRDDSFVNRIEIFNDINKLSKQHRRVAISGIGGVGSVRFTEICSTAKLFLESRKLQLNIATDSGIIILMYKFSGYTPVQDIDSIKHTKT